MSYSDRHLARRGNSTQIYTIHADGTELAQLTFTNSNTSPRWSPNGKKIWFLSSSESKWRPQLYVMDANGLNQTQISNSKEETTEPLFSPDGSYVVYRSDRTGSELWLANADGTEKKSLTGSTDDDIVWFHWLPNSKEIIYWSSGAIWIVDVTTLKIRKIADEFRVGINDNLAKLSPDGTHLAYNTGMTGPFDETGFSILDIRTGEITSYYPSGGAGWVWFFSADGNRIVFVGGFSQSTGTAELRSINLMGSGIKKIADISQNITGFRGENLACWFDISNKQAYEMRNRDLTVKEISETEFQLCQDGHISPDGRFIAYTKDGQLFIANIDGSGATNIGPNDLHWEKELLWQP